MTFAAIPTKYNGVQFRSRLEARWAAFFDLCGIEWDYEPFDCNGYIPDFLICGRMLAEVKPIVWHLHEHTEIKEAAIRGLESAFKEGTFKWLAVLGTTVYEWRNGSAVAGMAANFPDSEWDWGDLNLDWWSDGELSFGAQPLLQSRYRYPTPPSLGDFWREAGNRVQWRGVGAIP